jgi:hypothetical protein
MAALRKYGEDDANQAAARLGHGHLRDEHGKFICRTDPGFMRASTGFAYRAF